MVQVVTFLVVVAAVSLIVIPIFWLMNKAWKKMPKWLTENFYVQISLPFAGTAFVLILGYYAQTTTLKEYGPYKTCVEKIGCVSFEKRTQP